jgi:Spy/CpxP family protein refolding chaperone
MQHVSSKRVGLALVLTAALVGGVYAQQQHEQHHPGGAQAPQPSPDAPGPGAPAQPQQMQGMMDNMQGMMQHMQSMMERMHGMMSGQDMGITAQDEEDDEEASPQRRRGGVERGRLRQQDDDEEASPQRGMMGRRAMRGMGGMMDMEGMMRRHMERLAHQLEITDDQRAQVRTLLANHAKEAIRLRADIGITAIDVRQLLEAEPVDLPTAKQLVQSIASKEADLRVAHITLMQEISKLLTPEQRQKFRAMRERMMGAGGMMGMMGPSGMREPGGMMGSGHRER